MSGLDTLKLAHDLTDAGMPAEQAGAVAQAIDASMRDQVATRNDLEVLGARLEKHIAVVGTAIVAMNVTLTVGLLKLIG